MGSMSQKIKIFTEDEIASITSNYSTLIGKGGFGEVYKGVLDADSDLVAVKRYIRQDLRDEFMDEVNIHSVMNHNNVVKLIGYCIGESTLMLVTEYISNGNLDDILHRSDASIPLDVRLGIAIGCAEALSYMHSMDSQSDNHIYHGDIKPANILLDDNLTTKVSDFGLSRFLFSGTTQFTTTLKGSMGYMDPVYFHEGCLSPRSDVYSFGIVLLELLTRKRAKYGDVNLIPTFNKACAKGKGLRELFDAAIAEKDNVKILKESWKLASQCLSLNIHTRPQMNEVAKRLRMLKKELKTSPQSILATHSMWAKQYRQAGSSSPSFKKKLSFFKGNASSYSKVISELGGNVRVFTKEEINEVTHNYSNLLSGGTSATEVYKGTLEDNTMVAVHRLVYEGSEEAFINGGMVVSKIAHRNIVRVLGCCLEPQTTAFLYEYVAKGSILDILCSQEDFPLDLRMRIAIKTAEALQYLHSSETGVTGHGSVSASTILLDNNLVPKLTEFSRSCTLFKESETTSVVGAGVMITGSLLEKALNDDPSRYGSVLMNLESDVYRFGGVLMALVSRDGDGDGGHDGLLARFTRAYETEETGRALFDRDVITAEEDVALLDELGRLALKCSVLDADRIAVRPTMKEVANELRTMRRSWKERSRTTEAAAAYVDVATAGAGAAVVPAEEARLPNLMRHMFGYRRISVGDPIRVC